MEGGFAVVVVVAASVLQMSSSAWLGFGIPRSSQLTVALLISLATPSLAFWSKAGSFVRAAIDVFQRPGKGMACLKALSQRIL